MSRRRIVVSPPVLDPVLERVRKGLKLTRANLRALQRNVTRDLVRNVGITATVTVRPWSRAGEAPRMLGPWDEVQVLLAETAANVASESIVRLLNRIANRLGSEAPR